MYIIINFIDFMYAVNSRGVHTVTYNIFARLVHSTWILAVLEYNSISTIVHT